MVIYDFMEVNSIFFLLFKYDQDQICSVILDKFKDNGNKLDEDIFNFFIVFQLGSFFVVFEKVIFFIIIFFLFDKEILKVGKLQEIIYIRWENMEFVDNMWNNVGIIMGVRRFIFNFISDFIGFIFIEFFIFFFEDKFQDSWFGGDDGVIFVESYLFEIKKFELVDIFNYYW